MEKVGCGKRRMCLQLRRKVWKGGSWCGARRPSVMLLRAPPPLVYRLHQGASLLSRRLLCHHRAAAAAGAPVFPPSFVCFSSLFFKKFLAKQFVLCQKAQRGKFGEAFFRSCLGVVEGCFSGKTEDRCDSGKELMFHIGKQNHLIYSYSTLVSIYWHE